MSDDTLNNIERQISAADMPGLPGELRSRVLADVDRELRAARWDQRLARIVAAVLVIGVGLNVMNVTGSSAQNRPANLQAADVRASVVDTAIVVAQVSDVATAERFARQVAAAMGRTLTADEEAAIGAATRRVSRGTSGDRG
jgi:hypothetical protein